jgi:hypothetical protein
LNRYIVKIASLDNVLFFLLIAAAALFQLLSKALSKAGKNQSDETSTQPTPPTPPQVRRAPAESDADRIRKFLEALGQPPTSTPPAPVAPRTNIPPRPVAPVQPPAVMPRAWGLSREQQTKRDISQREIPPPKQPSRVQDIVPRSVQAPAAPAFEVYEGELAVELEQPIIVKKPVGAETVAAQPMAKEPDLKTDIATLLGSKAGLREAIILREVFGPPRSLQPLDVVESV